LGMYNRSATKAHNKDLSEVSSTQGIFVQRVGNCEYAKRIKHTRLKI
jgi:hypothetical protein